MRIAKRMVVARRRFLEGIPAILRVDGDETYTQFLVEAHAGSRFDSIVREDLHQVSTYDLNYNRIKSTEYVFRGFGSM